MRKAAGLGFIGVGVAVSAAVAIPASAAGAATAGTTYNSTATATAGSVSVGGNPVPVPGNTVTATDGSSPQSASLGLSALESALPSNPFGSALRKALPTGANLVTETATAQSDGMSSACAGFLAGDCASGKPQPITLSLSLADLPGLPAGGAGAGNSSASTHTSPSTKSPLAGITSSVKQAVAGATGTGTTSTPAAKSPGSSSPGSDPLAGYRIVLTLSGPEAACTAGPPGSSGGNFTATQSLASASLDILNHGKSVLPNGPVKLSAGEILSQLHQVPLPSQLQKALGSVPSSPLGLTINPGSTSGAGSGPVTTATAGELALSANGNQVLDVVGAKVACGPNKKAAGTAPAKTTKSEVPLGGGIQTDEGRSGSGDTALWLGVAGGVALAGTAGGLTLWRRRP